MTRLLFAHQLRALAVLCVVASHYAAVYWVEPGMVAAQLAAPPYAGPAPAVASWLVAISPFFNPGPFGVAVFFLVSGFVIPFSLERLTPGRFLRARALRIYPTYAVALAAGVALVAFMSARSGLPFPFTRLQVAANVLLVHPQLGQPSIDTVNWTLAAEIKFYLLMALLARWTGRPVVLAAAGLACAALASGPVAVLAGHPFLQAEARSFFDLAFIPFMLVGTLVRIHWRAGKPVVPLLAAAVVLLAAFAAAIRTGPLAPLWPAMWPSYGVALLVFGAAYALRGRVRPNRVVDWLADISYPLYAVHALLGYCVLDWTLAAGLPPAPAMAAALAAALAAAAVLHRTVERWSVRAGHRAPVLALPVPAFLRQRTPPPI